MIRIYETFTKHRNLITLGARHIFFSYLWASGIPLDRCYPFSFQLARGEETERGKVKTL